MIFNEGHFWIEQIAEEEYRIGFIETNKKIIELLSPLIDMITKINSDLYQHPNFINSSPYEKGWLFNIKDIKNFSELRDNND